MNDGDTAGVVSTAAAIREEIGWDLPREEEANRAYPRQAAEQPEITRHAVASGSYR